MRELLLATQKYIDAYKKIGTRELIIEAEKSYIYEQYELALLICSEILHHQREYPYEICVRAQELVFLMSYYHKDDEGISEHAVDDSIVYRTLSQLDKNSWQIYDSRLILGNYYVEDAKYEDAYRCFMMWYINRDKRSGLKEMADMYKRGQYDTDTLYMELIERYEEYYRGINVKDALVKSAKVTEEYFENYIHEKVCNRLSVSCRNLPKKKYTDDDFVLPHVIRTYDCADEIRKYAREVKHPTLEGCMLFLSQPEIRLQIEQKTMRAMEREYREALLRSHLANERRLVEIQEQDIQNRNRQYQELIRKLEEYERQRVECQRDYQNKQLEYQKQQVENQKKHQADFVWYQKQAVENQKRALEEERKFRREANYKLQRIVWNTDRF